MLGTPVKLAQTGQWPAHANLPPIFQPGITSAGTTSQANSVAWGADKEVAVVTTAAAAGGIRLPAPQGVLDTRVFIHDGGATAVLLFPASGGKINGLAANASLSIPTDKAALCVAINTTDWAVFLCK